MINLIKSSFYDEKRTKKKLADFILSCDRFSMHTQCKTFEEGFAKKQNRKYVVYVNSGSSANLVLIQALLNLGTLKKGDRVGVSALTWATNVMPLIQLGLIPVAIDCNLKTLNVSPKILKTHIKELDGFFLTNSLGFSDDMDGIRNLCRRHKVVLIEDNCESLGSSFQGTLLGNFGLASTFSTFVGHHLSTLEGGLICTDDEELYEALIMVRAHGWSRNLPKKGQEKLKKTHKVDDFYNKYTFYDLGYNVRPTEIGGFLGNIQLNFWDEIVDKREKVWQVFSEVIKDNEDFQTLDFSHMDIISNFAVPILVKSEELLFKYKKLFEENNVEIRPIIAGDITQQPFFKKYVTGAKTCPNAELAHKTGFYFGNNPELTKKEINLLKALLTV